MKQFVAFLIIISILSCKESVVLESKSALGDALPSVVQAIHLNPTVTKIDLTDYFTQVKSIDSVWLNDEFLGISNLVSILPQGLSQVNKLHVLVDDYSYDIPLLKSDKKRVDFKVKKGKYKTIAIKGEMNGWNPNASEMRNQGENWATEFYLSPGDYQYILLLDGKEALDPDNPIKKSNGIGGFNSVFEVKGRNKSKLSLLFQDFEVQDDKLRFQVTGATDIEAYWQNTILPAQFIAGKWEITIPEYSKEKERSHLRMWATTEHQYSQAPLIPLEFGRIMTDAKDLKRTDFHSMVLYNTFIDRFYNGNPQNDKPTDDPEILPKANYHGGDIKGVSLKIQEGYFKNLGVNSIWVSPVVKNPETAYGKYPEPKTKFSAYHGYWPISFTQVDQRLTSEAELKELVEVSHQANQNIFLDFVANHVHELHPIYQKNKDWATDLYLPDGSLNTERWDDHRLTTWFDTFMPTLDLSKPEVYEMLSDSAVYWIQEYGFDGFRHDATKHVPSVFWKTLTKKLKNEVVIAENRPIYQIGETYGTPDLISSYVETPQLDAQFDFNVYDAIVSCLLGNDGFDRLKTALYDSQKYYGAHHLMGNITGNQDRARFISYASGSLRTDEDSKYAGWNREIGVKDPVGYKKAALLNAIIASIPGVPVIYNGDEIGDPGGNDPDNRRMMRFEGLKAQESELLEITSRLMHFRRENMAAMYGDFTVVEFGDDFIALERSYLNQNMRLYINNSDSEKHFLIPPSFSKSMMGSTLRGSNDTAKFSLNAHSFEIWTN